MSAAVAAGIIGGVGALATVGVQAYNAANTPGIDVPGVGGLQGDISAFLDALIAENPEVFRPFNDVALVNPQSPIGALVAADIAVQLGRSPIDIGKGPTVTIVNPLTGEQSQIRLPGATNGKARKAFAAASANVAAAAQEGRFAAIERVAELQKDFPVATATEMQERINLVQGVLDSQTEQEFGRANDRLLETANLGGFSPSAGLGLLGEEFSQRNRQNDLDSIGVAIALLQGEQNQAVTGLNALQNSLNAPNQIGAQLAGIESQGLSNLGAQAANQFNSIRQGRNANLQAALGLLGQQQGNALQAQGANAVNQSNALTGFGNAVGDAGNTALLYSLLNQKPNALTPIQELQFDRAIGTNFTLPSQKPGFNPFGGNS